MTASLDVVAFGIFNLIGSEHAPRVARVRKPSALLIMEDLSLAFQAVERQRHRGIMVADDDVERLVRLLHSFFPAIGVKHSENEVREMVKRYLAVHSLPDAVAAPIDRKDIVVNHPLLDELAEVAAEVKVRFKCSWGDGDLIYIGLGCVDGEVSFSCYDWCSPLNCGTFASTGVDGTHFSLLVVDGAVVSDSPVVMTTPSNMGRSVIVGENLFDFLCLGSRSGYFLDSLAGSDRAILERLIDAEWYQGKPTSEWLENRSDEYPDNMLPYLVDRLDLHPWTDADRFDELQKKYASLMRLPPDVR